MYHGGQPGNGPRWFTQYLAYAQAYADKLPGGVVYYVDLPENSPWLIKSFDDSGSSVKSPYTNVELPAEIADKKQPVPTWKSTAANMGALASSPGPSPGEPAGATSSTGETPPAAGVRLPSWESAWETSERTERQQAAQEERGAAEPPGYSRMDEVLDLLKTVAQDVKTIKDKRTDDGSPAAPGIAKDGTFTPGGPTMQRGWGQVSGGARRETFDFMRRMVSLQAQERIRRAAGGV